METAMQELINWVREYEGKMISADQVVLKAFQLLLKEKDDIEDAFLNGHTNYSDYKTGENFYNECYESFLNKEITWRSLTTQ